MRAALTGISTAILPLLAASAVLAQDRIDFQVATGDKALERSLRNASGLATREIEKDANAQDLFAEARAEYGRILAALYGLGHYSGVIHVLVDGREAADIQPLDAPARIGTIRVTVDPGPVFKFSRAEIGPLAPKTEIPKGFAKGGTAESGLITGAASAAVDGWRAVGFAKARVAGQKLSADHAARTVSAEISMGPGPRLRFGPLRIEGQQRMQLRRLLKIAGYPEGEIYDPDKLDKVVQRLRRTGVFRAVSVTEDETITAPDRLGVTLTVAEERLRRISFGGELATIDGGTLTAEWMHRNLMGGGERLTITGGVTNIGAQDSGMDYKLGFTLSRPATITPDTTASLGFMVQHLDEADYRADEVTLTLGFTQIISDQLTARAAIGYNYIDGSDDVGSFRYRNINLPMGVTWDTRDSTVDATTGWYIDTEVKPFYGLDDTESGVRITGDARGYYGIGEESRVVLAGRAQLGAVLGAGLLGAPRSYLFYSGGGGTVRGQPFQSLGVEVDRNGNDYSIGGTHFLGLSTEARFKATDTIGIVGFIDVGSIGVDDFSGGDSEWHAGAGLGLRYFTGFGPIRLDIGAPVGGDTGDGVQLYVGLGQSF